MKNELVFKVYPVADPQFRVRRTMAWDMPSLTIVFGKYALHIFRKPSDH